MTITMKTSAGYLVQVYDAAHKQGEATTAVVALLKGAFKWSNEELVKAVGEAFKLGRIAGTLGVTREDAQTILGNRPPKQGREQDDKTRTPVQDRAVRTATSAWSYACLQAGMPSKQTGKTRAPQMAGSKDAPGTTSDENNETTVPVTLDKVSIPRVRNTSDVAMFALSMADAILKFENRNADVKFDAYRQVFTSFVESVRSLVKEGEGSKAA